MASIKSTKEKVPERSLDDIVQDIGLHLEKTGNTISALREHAIHSQLRGIIYRLGFVPRETREKPATLVELLEQLKICISHASEMPEENLALIMSYAGAVESNLRAELSHLAATTLREVPLTAKTAQP